MSPFAIDSPTYGNGLDSPPREQSWNGGALPSNPEQPELLRRFPNDELHDLICIGFGPASLAIAVALYDNLESGYPCPLPLTPKVRFLERRPRFAWHPGMMIPGAKMQISFVKDLATLRNPRSRFTFLNYLQAKNRLAAFTNLGTFLPERMEYEDYMRWCADHFDDVVDYHQDVQAVDVGQTNLKTGAVEYFQIRSWDRHTEQFVSLKARHIVIAVGGEVNIPSYLDVDHPCVIHSSKYESRVPDLTSMVRPPKSVAVIGGGQSAAEIFHDIPSRFPDAKAYLLVRGSALRPSDDSPFVNEIFDPDRVDTMYDLEPNFRAKSLVEDRATNYGVVRLELLEAINSTLYSYRIKYREESEWPQQILPHRTATGIDILPEGGPNAVRVHFQSKTRYKGSLKCAMSEALDADLVVIASGYKRNAHESLLKTMEHLMPSHEGDEDRWEVNRDYSISFKAGSVQHDAGVWLQGCNESTHGLSDTLLSILATRGGEMVQSIFGYKSCKS